MAVPPSPAPEFQPAQRVLRGWTSALEKRALVWLAQRMPRWVNSDHLTVLGLLAMAGAGLCYWGAKANILWLWGVNVCLVLNWFGDSLDGTLARVRDKQRPRYGFYVDHVVDALSATFLLGGLGFSGLMSTPVAVALLIVYLLLSVESYLATYTVGEFKITHFGFGPTELRLLLIVGNCFLYYDRWADLFGHRYLLYDAGGVIGAVMLGVVFVRAMIRNTRKLYKEETR
jgi:archaetidylinositol phosphate synthase